MKIADIEIHKHIAEMMVINDYCFDLTTWNKEVEGNKEWIKKGILNKEILLDCIKAKQDELNIYNKLIIL